MKIMVTGGAGFIGTSAVRHLLAAGVGVVNVDKLTYAGSNPPLGTLAERGRYTLEIADVADRAALDGIFARHRWPWTTVSISLGGESLLNSVA